MDNLDPIYPIAILRVSRLALDSTQATYGGLLISAARRIAIEGTSPASVVMLTSDKSIPIIYNMAEELASLYKLILPLSYETCKAIHQIWFCNNVTIAVEVREIIYTRNDSERLLTIARLTNYDFKTTEHHLRRMKNATEHRPIQS